MKTIIMFSVLVFSSLINAQYIKVMQIEREYYFIVDRTKYTLPEVDGISYRVWDDKMKCILGESGPFDFLYEPIFFTREKGDYEIVIYIVKDKPIIKEKVMVR